MLTLVRRRAAAQWRLLTGVVALVTVATTLLGVGALLLTSSQDRAFSQSIETVGRTRPQDVAVTAYLVDVGPDVVRARDAASEAVGEVLAPVGSTTSATTVARLRRLQGGPATTGALAYLESDDALARRAVLTSGHPPAGPGEALVPDAALAGLDLALGDRVVLGSELTRTLGEDVVETPVSLTVVGTFRPRSRTGWENDPLAGAGAVAGYSDGSVTAPAYGPLVVDDATFLASGSTVDAVQVVGRPDLAAARPAAVSAAAAAAGGGTAVLDARVGDDARLARVASALPTTVRRIAAQQSATRSTLLVVLLLASTASVVALLLASRLVQASREGERARVVGLGADRRQLVAAAAGEAGVLALVSALVAVPAAALVQSGVTHLPVVAAAGLAQAPGVTGVLVATVGLGALLLAAVLVVPVVTATTVMTEGAGAPGPGGGARGWREGATARAGVDALLVLVVGVTGWSVLAASGTGAPRSGNGVDAVATLAPVACLLAGCLLVARAVPVLLALLARTASRSRALLLPLATAQAARRGQGAAAFLLLVVSVAATTFAVAERATWERSQDDQAALRVGTDLSLALAVPATATDAASVAAAATGSAAVSPVVSRPLALGRYLGDAGDPPVLVAVDQARAGELLRGRLDGGEDWSRLGARLAPAAAAGGVALPPDGAGVTLGGTAPAGVGVSATARLVLQDATGFRSSTGAAPVRLDGRDRLLQWDAPVGTGRSVVAVQLTLASTGGPSTGDAAVAVHLTVPPAGGSTTGSRSVPSSWQASVLGSGQSPARAAGVVVDPAAADGTVVTTSATLDLASLQYDDGDVLATAFDVPEAVPVAVSQRLVDVVGARVGGTLAASVDEVAVPLEVVAVVPDVPSAPGRVAVLADVDLLSRALVAGGRLDPVVDGWWVGDPPPTTAAAARALGLGEVTTRGGTARELSHGPLQVLVPTGLVVLEVAAPALVLAGAVLLLSSEGRRRSQEVARLRALGLSRRGARLLVLGEHVTVLLPLLVLGAAVGAAASALLGPPLVRSDLGSAPAPTAVAVWPWVGGTGLLASLAVGCLVVAALVARGQVRRSDTARIGAGE